MTKPTSSDRIQCHFISNTHWDREWRFSAQRTRHMLVQMIDMLLDIFDKEPKYKSFHLDSQCMPLQDYLEIRPEKEDTLRQFVQSGRLQIGPWFCLPDEYCVAGESLIRNLLLGHRIAHRFGSVSKTGYAPFSWGQISQMPQIYKGFGIEMTSFYRGINTLVAPRSEFIWVGADGTQILASRLARRPRYNVWYIIQRPVYWGEKNENNRVMSWKNGHGPFRFADAHLADLDYQYVHPRYEYHREEIAQRAQQALKEQDAEWTTPHRFWSCGHDSSCPDIREVQLIADCDEALGDQADVFHSSIAEWQRGLLAANHEDWPVVKGEMRHTSTPGSSSVLYGLIISARMYLKQENFRTEQLLNRNAEPFAVFASLLGAPYPGSFLQTAWNWLLQNHGHDSIGGCSRDVVHEDMLYRFRQSREISICVLERALMDIVGAINLKDWSPADIALAVINPSPCQRSEVFHAEIEIPDEWNCQSIKVLDESGKPIPMQYCGQMKSPAPIVQSPNDVANMFPSRRFSVRLLLKDIPGCGYRVWKVIPHSCPPMMIKQGSQLRGPHSMRNEFIEVSIQPNGTFDLLDCKTGKVFHGLGYFMDSGEIGNPWQHLAPEMDRTYTTLSEKARISLVRDGELETSFRIELDWLLPESRSEDDRARSERLVSCRIINTLTLRCDQPWVEIETVFENHVCDHYLRVCFPTHLKTDVISAQGQFDVLQRKIEQPNQDLFDELLQPEMPMNSFVDIHDGCHGLALLNEGLKAYTAHNDPLQTVSLTLLRCFPLRIAVTQDMIDYSKTNPGSQCLGKQIFRYAVMPHIGDYQEGGVWTAAEKFTTHLRGIQVGPTPHGHLPLRHSFLEIQPEQLDLSAVKRSEDETGWIVRLFNPTNEMIQGTIRLNSGFSGTVPVQSPVERQQADYALPTTSGKPWDEVWLVSLEEVPINQLTIQSDGRVAISIASKQILTLLFK